jgi:murein DD-endopeptidase MepM/ murein hydrolase activator NlpD
MKDIIAAQQINRRSGAAMLSDVLHPPVFQDSTFIADQHLYKRKRKSLFERIHGSGEESFTRPLPAEHHLPEHRTPKRHMPEHQVPERNTRGWSIWKRNIWERFKRFPETVLTAGALFTRKKLIVGVLVCFSVGCLAFVSYIPDPDPPQDSRVQEARGASGIAPHVWDEIPLDLTEEFAWQSYTVVSGDSVEGISRRFGLSLDAIIASNDLRNVRQLRAGERIRIPNMDGIPYTVQSGDSYTGIAEAQNVPLEAILDANDIQSNEITAGTVLFIPGAKMDKTALRQALGTFFIWPIPATRLSSNFGWRKDPFTGLRSYHAGLDIPTSTGTSVKAAADGRVSATGFNAVYGNFLIVSHGDTYQTMYAHLSKILVKTGTYVNQGTVIARSGNTGRSTGPHLHFSVYKNKVAVNPIDVVNK